MLRIIARQKHLTSISSLIKRSDGRCCKLAYSTRCLSSLSSPSPDNNFPTSAEIVVAGAGAVGSAVAYHLAKLGKKDVVVLEQGSLGCGTSWHAVGLLSKCRGNSLLYNMSQYASELYANLYNDTGYDTGYKRCGAILLARTKDRETLLRRLADKMRQFGTPVELISPKEAQDLYPIIQIDDIRMALWSPSEGAVNASDVCQSLMKGATQNGVRYIEGVTVNNIATNGRQVIGVSTDKGFIKCEKFINCAGQWARDLGLRSDTPVNIPLHSTEHFYIVTKPMPGVHTMLPTLRDHDGYFYVREWSGGLMAGGFEPLAKPCFYKDGIPEKFEFQLLQEDWDQFGPILENIVHRIPSIENAEIRQFVNGPESFSPDLKFMLGEVPEVNNYFVAAGMSSNGIVCAAGMGKIVAELVTTGTSEWDASAIDIKRLTKEQNNKLYLYDRVKQVVGRHYSVPYPHSSLTAARNLKCSPVFDLLDKSGARWGENTGWEVANYFAEDGEDIPWTFGKPGWLKWVEKEYNACKKSVAIADLSWQSKFEITLKDCESSLETMQYVFAEDVNVAVGQSVKSALLTEHGQYKGVVEMHRIANDRFLLVCAPAQHNHILQWLRRRFEDINNLNFEDVTARYSSLAILGPSALNVLAELTRSALNSDDFNVGQCKIIDLAYASDVILCRGFLNSEDNWQAFIPSELARNVFQMIRNCGSEHGIKTVGQFSLDNLRIEASIPEDGNDISPFTSPSELGAMSFVNICKTTPFIGKEAIQESYSNVKKSLTKLYIDDVQGDNWVWGGEPVFADGEIIGSLTSVSYCFGKGKPVALGIFDKAKIDSSSSITIQVAGDTYSASTSQF
eukprot:gene19005-20917_t